MMNIEQQQIIVVRMPAGERKPVKRTVHYRGKHQGRYRFAICNAYSVSSREIRNIEDWICTSDPNRVTCKTCIKMLKASGKLPIWN